jgi:PAS domain S-box-containing protein
LRPIRRNVCDGGFASTDTMEPDEALARLKAVEERLLLTLAAGDIGMWEWSLSTGKLDWDDRARTFWNVDVTETPTLERFLEGIHPEDRAPTQAALQRALDPASGGAYEAVIRLASGERTRWVLSRGRCHFDDAGRPLRIVGTVLDITERELLRESAQAHARRAETWGKLAARLLHATSLEDNLRAICEEVMAALRMSSAKIYLMDESSDVAVCAYVHGLAGGPTPSPVSRADIEARIERDGRCVQYPDLDAVTWLPNLELRKRAGIRSLAMGGIFFEGALLGNLVLSSVGVARRLDEDEMGFLSAAADLASVAVHNFRVAEQHRRILAMMTEGVALFDAEDRFIFVNASGARMLGYEVGELLGKSVEQAWFPEERAARIERARVIFAEGAPVRRNVRYRTKSGGELWASSALVPLRTGDRHTGVLAILTDITEARKLEAKVQHAQKLESLGVLAGGIAHDFNNLLVGILGNAGLALDELPPEAPARDQLADIHTAAIRASELTKQLLAYAGKGRFVIGHIDLHRLVAEMGHLLTAVIPRNVLIKYCFAADLPPVEGDATQLRQVVMNLITNAADAVGARSGIITVSTSLIEVDRAYLADTYLDEGLPGGHYVSFEVSDTGVGMTPETRMKIFDPFFTTKFTGRGLGLAAVIGILRSHRAAIKVYSEVGRGSTFRVLFPAVEGAPDSFRGTAGLQTGWRGSGTILVVDDDGAVRSVARRILERAGFRVLVASDGVDGITVFREHINEVCAVMLDVTMPRMGGEEAFRQLRQLAPEVRVLLSSGYSAQEATSRFAGKGLAGFVEKPFTPQELITRLRLVLEAPPSPTGE